MVNMQTSDNQDPIDGVAIIGMVGRFPGAGNVDEFWRNLCEGLESTTFFQDEELDPSIDPNLCKDPSYVKARGIIPGEKLLMLPSLALIQWKLWLWTHKPEFF